MKNSLLIHALAWETAQQIGCMLRRLDREGKQEEAFIHVYAHVTAGLECLLHQEQRRRIVPSLN